MSGRFLPRLHLKAENNFNCSVLLTLRLATVTTRSLLLAISYAQLFHGLVFAHVAYQFDEKVEDFTVITGPSGWPAVAGSQGAVEPQAVDCHYVSLCPSIVAAAAIDDADR